MRAAMRLNPATLENKRNDIANNQELMGSASIQNLSAPFSWNENIRCNALRLLAPCKVDRDIAPITPMIPPQKRVSVDRLFHFVRQALIDQHDLDAAVLLESFRRVVRGHGIVFASP